MFEILQVSRENNLAKKGKKNSAGAAVPPPFLHSSILFSTKATAVPNCRFITLLWAEIMHVLLLVSKSGTSASPLCSNSFLNKDNEELLSLILAFLYDLKLRTTIS